MSYSFPRGNVLISVSLQTIVTGVILGGSLLTAVYYFYVTSRSANANLRSKRKGKSKSFYCLVEWCKFEKNFFKSWFFLFFRYFYSFGFILKNAEGR